VVLVGAGAEEAERNAIGPRPLAHEPSDLHLIQRRRHPAERSRPQLRRDLIEQILDARNADRSEHRCHIGLRVRNEGHQ